MKNLFNSIKLTKPKKNVFDLTHDVKLTGKMGNLIPVCNFECVPGDKFIIGCDSVLRFAPLLAPIMHRVDVTVHYFFVPNRILWDNWEKWITDANSGIVAPFIFYSGGGWTNYEKLMDYMGIPPKPTTAANANISALPFAAYQAIYNEYYRDQNLVNEVNYKLTDGSQAAIADLLTLRKRSWEHDYFTSCLPWQQKGAAVDIPLGEVELKDLPLNPMNVVQLDGDPQGATALQSDAGGVLTNNGGTEDLVIDPSGNYVVGATTINELRRAFRLQEWLEKNARGGTRYIEQILAHFGVKSSDARLQRPEYITGVKSPVVISEVLNTTGIDGELPQGNMAGHGINVNSGKSGAYYCEEHGIIMGIMSVMPKTAYQQGIPKMFLKDDNLDYFWPSFAHIGEQAVVNNEVYAYSNTPNDVFGYVPRYAEYKFLQNRVAGEFRTNLDYWHLGRKFATQPALNQTFIECDPAATSRIFAVEDQDVDNLYCQILHKITAIRPMPKFGTPTF